jgi:acyl-CoA synthetase (AMP-forming)/AMP-acid ligase II
MQARVCSPLWGRRAARCGAGLLVRVARRRSLGIDRRRREDLPIGQTQVAAERIVAEDDVAALFGLELEPAPSQSGSKDPDNYGDAEATEKAMTADGWVRSGDLGHLLGDGSFVFETRMGDVLRLGGYLVAPSEIEAHIQCYPGIDGCQAVGAVGEDGPVVVAFVTLRPGVAFDEAALRQYCAKDLARFKTPARCVALEAFPTTPGANGAKVQRAKLREMAQRLLTA